VNAHRLSEVAAYVALCVLGTAFAVTAVVVTVIAAGLNARHLI
jgi:hypothetical protein